MRLMQIKGTCTRTTWPTMEGRRWNEGRIQLYWKRRLDHTQGSVPWKSKLSALQLPALLHEVKRWQARDFRADTHGI